MTRHIPQCNGDCKSEAHWLTVTPARRLEEDNKRLSAPWASFPGKPPVCRDCGNDWRPVQRMQCVVCGSDAGPLRKEWVYCGRGPCSSCDGHHGACER